MPSAAEFKRERKQGSRDPLRRDSSDILSVKSEGTFEIKLSGGFRGDRLAVVEIVGWGNNDGFALEPASLRHRFA